MLLGLLAWPVVATDLTPLRVQLPPPYCVGNVDADLVKRDEVFAEALIALWQRVGAQLERSLAVVCMDNAKAEQALLAGELDVALAARFNERQFGTLFYSVPYIEISEPALADAQSFQLAPALKRSGDHGRSVLRAAVANADRGLVLEINRIFRQLSRLQLQRLSQHYLGSFSNVSLIAGDLMPVLSEAEEAWLIDHPLVYYRFGHWQIEPYGFVSQSRKLGLSELLLAQLGRRIGVSIAAAEHQPQGLAELPMVDPMVFYRPELNEQQLSDPYMDSSLVLVTRSAVLATQLLSKAEQDWRLALSSRQPESLALFDLYPAAQFSVFDHLDKALAVVEKGQVDGLLMDAFSARYQTALGRLEGFHLERLEGRSELSLHLYPEQPDPRFIGLLNKALRGVDERYLASLETEVVGFAEDPYNWRLLLQRYLLVVLVIAGLFMLLLGWAMAAYIAIRRRRVYAAKLKALVKQAELAREQAELAGAARVDFLARMSHEIRTPMNGVLGMAEALVFTPLNGEQRDKLSVLQRSAQSLLSILNDILDFTKLDSRKVTLERVPIDLAELMRQIEGTFRFSAESKNILLVLYIDEQLRPTYLTDPTRLGQLCNNLVSNAVKFTEQGWVELSVLLKQREGNQDRLEFKVVDTGIGIPQDKQAELFNAFYQAEDHTTRRFGGTGLGLSICQEIAKAMGCEITLHSEHGKGSQFSFELTLEATEQEPLNLRAADPAVEQMSDFSHLNARVLVAEDNAVNRRVIQSQLERLGIKPVLAEDGVQALKLCRREPFDVVLSDCHMPNMDGFELVRRIKQELDQHLIVIAITADAVGDAAQKCLDAGFDDYVSKPVAQTQLQLTLYRAFSASGMLTRNDFTPADELQQQADEASEFDAMVDRLFEEVEQHEISSPSTSVEPFSEDFIDDLFDDEQESGVNIQPPPQIDAAKTAADSAANQQGEIPAEMQIQRQAITELVGEDTALLGELIDVYLSDASAMLVAIDQAIAAQSFDAIQQSVHKLKGSARYFAVQGVVALCEQMEAAAGQHQIAEVQARQQALHDGVQLMNQQLEAWRQQL